MVQSLAQDRICCNSLRGLTESHGGEELGDHVFDLAHGSIPLIRLVHPDALFPIKIGGKPLPDRVINAVWGFFSLYVFSFTMLSLIMGATGLDMVTAFSAVAACLNNMGPGLGDVSANYAGVSAAGKWVLCVAMLLGRLELFTLLVLFTPTFWRN